MKQIYCFLLILYPYLGTMAQQPTIKPLTIGDKVPDITFTQIVNGQSQTAKLSQFKAKLLILDFWATWCSSCLKKFPLLDSLKQAHGNDMQVLLINGAGNGDTKEKVERLFTKMAIARGQPLHLPAALNDLVTPKLFPHNQLPHYVWLDSNFKVTAITGPGEITAQNIKAAISGHLPSLTIKEDMQDFESSSPLFIAGNGGSGSGIRFRSTLSTRIPGLASSTVINKDSNGLITHILLTNEPVLHLLMQAYQPRVNQNRFHFRFSDSNSINLVNKNDVWIAANSYTYELMVPPSSPTDARRYMQQDLQRFFSLAAKTEMILSFCYSLTADTALLSKHTSTGGKPVNDLYEKAGRYMHNRAVSTLSAYLDAKLGIPVIDETGFTRNINLALPEGDIFNIATLQNILRPYGLLLTPAQRMLSNFIIYQPK